MRYGISINHEKHTLTLTLQGPQGCGKSTLLIRLYRLLSHALELRGDLS